jgi:hypothetical protein
LGGITVGRVSCALSSGVREQYIDRDNFSIVFGGHTVSARIRKRTLTEETMRRLGVSCAATTIVTLAALAAPGVAAASNQAADLVSGSAVLRNAASGMCLDQDFSGGQDQRRVIAHGCHNGANQIWKIEMASIGTIRLINQLSGKCLDQDYGTGVPGPLVTAYSCHDGLNQQWIPEAYDGSFSLRNAKSRMCLDQDYGTGVPGSAVTAYPCHGGLNQRWH